MATLFLVEQLLSYTLKSKQQYFMQHIIACLFFIICIIMYSSNITKEVIMDYTQKTLFQIQSVLMLAIAYLSTVSNINNPNTMRCCDRLHQINTIVNCMSDTDVSFFQGDDGNLHVVKLSCGYDPDDPDQDFDDKYYTLVTINIVDGRCIF